MINDLIEKLSNLRSQFNCFDENERDAYHTLSEAIKVLSEQPEPCEDAVSRQKLLNEYYRLRENWNNADNAVDKCISVLKDLPSAQPETDCVFKEFGNCSYSETGCSDCKVKAKIRNALSVQPEPYGDVVNRANVVDMLDMYPFTEYGEYETAREIVKRLPSVEPKHKTWKWIEYDSDDDKYDVIKCPCCKHTFTVDAYHWTDIGFVKDDFKFCPNCSADMRGKQDE